MSPRRTAPHPEVEMPTEETPRTPREPVVYVAPPTGRSLRQWTDEPDDDLDEEAADDEPDEGTLSSAPRPC